MITIAICDDEAILLVDLHQKITSFMKSKNIEHSITPFSSAEAMLISCASFDLVFLDIKLQGINGMNAAKRLRDAGKKSAIVFITAFQEYVFDAFDVDAANYLMKPLNDNKLSTVLEKLCLQSEKKDDDYIVIKRGSSYQKIMLSDISFFEVTDHKILVHTNNGIVDYYGRIDSLEKQLTSCLFRCHRSFIVNFVHIRKFDRGTVYLQNGETVLISKRKYNEFSLAYMHFLKANGGML